VGQAIEYQKIMTEIVYINLPGPQEPEVTMSGGELLHGFLADLQRTANPETKKYIDNLCFRWNVHYRQNKFG
jgi:hypothetical protein